MSAQQKQMTKLAAALVEFSEQFSRMSREDCQWAIQNTKEAIGLFVEAVRNRSISALVGLPEGTVIRRATVDRSRTPQEVVDATGRREYIDKDVLATMPLGEGDEVDVYFIPAKRFVPASEVPAFLAQYGLVPDPRAQAAVNEADPAFADEHPNGSQWGNSCCLLFNRWDDGRRVFCNRYDGDWDDDWFQSGVPAPRK